MDPAFRAVMEERLLELGSHFGIEDFFSGWFRDAPFESIRSAPPTAFSSDSKFGMHPLIPSGLLRQALAKAICFWLAPENAP